MIFVVSYILYKLYTKLKALDVLDRWFEHLVIWYNTPKCEVCADGAPTNQKENQRLISALCVSL